MSGHDRKTLRLSVLAALLCLALAICAGAPPLALAQQAGAPAADAQSVSSPGAAAAEAPAPGQPSTARSAGSMQGVPVTRATPDGPLVPEVPVASAPPAQQDAPPVIEPDDVRARFRAKVFFDGGSAALRPTSRAVLDDVADKSAAMDPEIIMAIGHTDARGSDDATQTLSIRRAEAVKAYLVHKGVVKNRIYTEGKGKRLPQGDNATSAGRADNNRVDIEVVGAAPQAAPADGAVPPQ